jgi:hypothetical protein
MVLFFHLASDICFLPVIKIFLHFFIIQTQNCVGFRFTFVTIPISHQKHDVFSSNFVPKFSSKSHSKRLEIQESSFILISSSYVRKTRLKG